MKEYNLSLTESNILLYQEIDGNKHKRRYGKSAYDAYKKIDKKNYKEEIIGNDKVLTSDSIIYIKDYKKIEKELDKLNIPKQVLKKTAIGFAGFATITTLSMGITNIEKNEQTNIQPVIEKIEEEKTQIDVSSIEKQADEYIERMSNPSILPDDSTIAYVNTTANYDIGLDENIKEYEADIIKAANRWGVDPNIMKDIFKQESSGGKAKNKGQVEYNAWHDMKMVCYNYDKQKYQTIVLTNHPENYTRKANEPEYVFISEKEFQNPYTSIATSTLIFSYIYNNWGNKNLTFTITIYNQGYKSAKKVYMEQSRVENIPYEVLINDETNTRYAKYSYVVDRVNDKGEIEENGDRFYLEHVLGQSTDGFDIDSGKTYIMPYIDEDGSFKEKETVYKSSRTKEIASIY